MQVQIHDEIIQNNKDADDNISSKYRIITTDALSIANYTAHNEDDNNIQNVLYSKMLNFVSSYNISGKINDEKMDKEIKAAFESVYPRSGVSAFLTITTAKGKIDQLMELAKIVLGIRLFNKSIGKGGYGIPNTDKDMVENLEQILQNMNDQIKYIIHSNKKREKLIIKSILMKRKADMKEELERRKANPVMDDDILDIHDEYEELLLMISKEGESPQSLGIYKNEQVIKWINELAFHNQYLNYLTQFQFTFQAIHDRINFISQSLYQSCEELGTMVGSKSVISKKLVYPKFLALGNVWYECIEESVRYKNAKKSFDLLTNTYEQALVSSLNISDDELNYLHWIEQSELQQITNEQNQAKITNNSDAKPNPISNKQLSQKEESKDDAKSGPAAEISDAKEYKSTMSENKLINIDGNLRLLSSESKSVLVTGRRGYFTTESQDVHFNPQCTLLNPMKHPELKHLLSQSDFISILPITTAMPSEKASSSRKNSNNNILQQVEFNGFCPFTLVDKNGTLVQGNIQLGVLQYQKQYYMFDNTSAIKAFVKNPSYYLEKVQKLILAQPEYLLLLNQSNSEKFQSISSYLFPSPSSADPRAYEEFLNKVSTSVNKMHKVKCDASTETPTHFVESNR